MVTFLLYYYSAFALLWAMELEAERIRSKKTFQREYQGELAYTSGIQQPLYFNANGQKPARKGIKNCGYQKKIQWLNLWFKIHIQILDLVIGLIFLERTL